MKDQLKSISADLATNLTEHFQSPEVRALIADTRAAADTDAGIFEVVATTENLDRYNEVIKKDGWDVDNYLLNSVVLWMHDHRILIGAVTELFFRDGKMIAKGKFAPTAEAQEKRRLYDLGFLKAVSVGFIEKEREGNLITKAELLEISFVSVPANPYALSLAMEKGLGINELVTKGIMFVERGAEGAQEPQNEPETVPESEDGAEAVETPGEAVEEAQEAQERNFSTRQIAPVISSLKQAIVALEALGITTEEQEGDDASEDDDVEDQETKRFLEFGEKRKLLQDASTMIGEVLAEARQAIEANKAS